MTEFIDIDCPRFVVFNGVIRVAIGGLAEVTAVARQALASEPEASIQVFDARTGDIVDLDLRASPTALPRANARHTDDGPSETARRGRPKLGVTAREVTLLPRHWEWLALQPGGASATLRRLVDAARKTNAEADLIRSRQNAAYRFMFTMAGDAPGFEEASRALFAGDDVRLSTFIAKWPAHVRMQVLEMLHGD